MDNRPYGFVQDASVRLHGRMVDSHHFKLDCGFEIPLGQMEWLSKMFGRTSPLRLNDEVSFTIKYLDVTSHVHRYKCECGQAQ